jgi:hypothetical protein
MSPTEQAIRALIHHSWQDAKEWASALATLSDVTDSQLDERCGEQSLPVHRPSK